MLEAASRTGITVVSSASILQAKLAKELPDEFASSMPGLTTDAQRAIQFTRSAPGITTALVGMSRTEHVVENLGVARVSPLDREQYLQYFRTTV